MGALTLLLAACGSPTTTSSQDLPIDRGQASLSCNDALLGTSAVYSHTIENLQVSDTVWVQKRQDSLNREHGVKLVYKDSGIIEFTYTPNFDFLSSQPNAEVNRVPGTTDSFQIKNYLPSGDTIFTAIIEQSENSVNLALVGTCVK